MTDRFEFQEPTRDWKADAGPAVIEALEMARLRLEVQADTIIAGVEKLTGLPYEAGLKVMAEEPAWIPELDHIRGLLEKFPGVALEIDRQLARRP